ncbi:hypothetical protein PEC301296_13920 [Pectobacterium carotovorum subsp. carotovorum]|nr:hypothetical protein GZ59_19680 [Pectobacterium atrosepticum]POW31996.1 hypothetical protein PB72LOC_00344 [Pectobacterium atrosepticum]GKV85080.1 hypothetical protein PEC301296_13920 [Pectobacterium carotovorum subsp. carotovorum]
MPFMALRSLIIRINAEKGYPNGGMAGKIRHSLNALRNFRKKHSGMWWKSIEEKRHENRALEWNHASSLRRANCSK